MSKQTPTDADLNRVEELERPWRDKELLNKLYHEYELSSYDVADLMGCSFATVLNNLDSTRSRSEAMMRKGEKYHDEDLLRKEYIENEKSIDELCKEWSCSNTAIREALKRYDIEIRPSWSYVEKNYVRLETTKEGYVRWSFKENSEICRTIAVHRLLAVAEYGVDAVKDKVVHHKNGIPWDNRPENIEVMSAGEHSKLHYEQGDILQTNPLIPNSE